MADLMKVARLSALPDMAMNLWEFRGKREKPVVTRSPVNRRQRNAVETLAVTYGLIPLTVPPTESSVLRAGLLVIRIKNKNSEQ